MQNNWPEIETYDDLEPEAKRFCDWLIKPKSKREIETQFGLADELGISKITSSDWNNRKTFNRIREERYREIRAPKDLEDVVNATKKRATLSEGKEANEATEIFLNWYYNQDFTKGTQINNVNSNADEELRQRIKGSLASNED